MASQSMENALSERSESKGLSLTFRPAILIGELLVSPQLREEPVKSDRSEGGLPTRLCRPARSRLQNVSTLAKLPALGVSLDAVTSQLQDEGVASFPDSFKKLIEGVSGKVRSREAR